MESAFELNTTPSFATPILRQRVCLPPSFLTVLMTLLPLQNNLRIKVGFPGIGNNLEADIPIEITSGLVTPSPEAEAPPYDGPPGPLDLPPYESSSLQTCIIADGRLLQDLLGWYRLGRQRRES